MDKYQYIKNPLTNRKVRIDSKLGKTIIRQYVKNMVGGVRIDDKVNEEDEVEDCPICLKEIDNGDDLVGLIPCKHIFHKACVEGWLREKGTCPMRCKVTARHNVEIRGGIFVDTDAAAAVPRRHPLPPAAGPPSPVARRAPPPPAAGPPSPVARRSERLPLPRANPGLRVPVAEALRNAPRRPARARLPPQPELFRAHPNAAIISPRERSPPRERRSERPLPPGAVAPSLGSVGRLAASTASDSLRRLANRGKEAVSACANYLLEMEGAVFSDPMEVFEQMEWRQNQSDLRYAGSSESKEQLESRLKMLKDEFTKVHCITPRIQWGTVERAKAGLERSQKLINKIKNDIQYVESLLSQL